MLAFGAADLALMQRRPISVRPRAVAETIGLRADAEGEGLRVQWDRASRPVCSADHATLFIEDGATQSHLDLTGRQLDGSTVMYWPESERVTFRLEVYRGRLRSSDSTAFGMPKDRKRRRQAGPARAIVEQARPSPFEHVEPLMVVTQTLPAVAPQVAAVAVAVAEPAQESRLDRLIGRIPLLRRWRKHPPAEGTERR